MMWKYLKKYWIFAVFASSFMVGEVLCDLCQPGMMARIIDNGILGLSNNGVPDLDLVKSEGGRMLLAVVLGGSCGVLSGVFTEIPPAKPTVHLLKVLCVVKTSAERFSQLITGFAGLALNTVPDFMIASMQYVTVDSKVI